jgi:hypothetical protein
VICLKTGSTGPSPDQNVTAAPTSICHPMVCVRYRQGFPTALHPIYPNPGVSCTLFVLAAHDTLSSTSNNYRISTLTLPRTRYTRQADVVCGTRISCCSRARATGRTGFDSPRLNARMISPVFFLQGMLIGIGGLVPGATFLWSLNPEYVLLPLRLPLLLPPHSEPDSPTQC